MSVDKTLQTSISVNAEEQAIAFSLAVLRRVWSTEAQKRCVRAIAAYYGMTVA
jgi:hypothetical protein